MEVQEVFQAVGVQEDFPVVLGVVLEVFQVFGVQEVLPAVEVVPELPVAFLEVLEAYLVVVLAVEELPVFPVVFLVVFLDAVADCSAETEEELVVSVEGQAVVADSVLGKTET